MALYIKTDGPIPEGCDYITAGKVYPVDTTRGTEPPCVSCIGDDGEYSVFVIGSSSPQLAKNASFYFCDEYGNPVLAPWEEQPSPHSCKNCLGIDPDSCMFRKTQGINYRAHAEALAEALRGMVGITNDSDGVSGYHLNGAVAMWGEFPEVGTACAALAAFDQDRGNK